MKLSYDKLNSDRAYIYYIILFVASLAVFFAVGKNEFLINWDDGSQIVNNPDITSLSYDGIKKIFSSYYVGMYQPLTTVSYAIDYAVGGLSSSYFHFFQLLYHIIVVFLVYHLLKYISGKPLISFIFSLIFAIHPLQVESVAWLSARSNILFSLFYLLAVLSYLKFLRKNKRIKYYVYTCIFFLLSCLSKSAAVTLPVLLVAIDFFYDKINWKNLLNKLPFFALSIIFGLITIDARIKASHLVEMNEHYNYFELIIITAFSIYRYIQLFLFHNDYSAFYTYPEKMNEWLPAKFYMVSLIFILIFIFISWRLYKKNKPALFGMVFFLITLSVMLKFIPAGMQYMADRYMYLPMFGLFVGLTQFREDFYKKHFKIFMGLIFLYIVLFAYKTIYYNRYWKNESVLFEQTLKTQPNAVPVKNFLGIMHKKNGDFKEALKYFNEIISRYPEYGSAYNNRGNLYKDMQKYDLAMQDYNMALIYEGEKPEIMLNIGLIYALTEDFEMALSFFNKALETDSEFYLGYFNRGKIFAMKGFYEKALSDMNETIRLNPYFSMAYYSRGMIYYNIGDIDKACIDLQKSKELGNSLSVEQIGKICN